MNRRFIIATLLVAASAALSAHHTISTHYDPARHATLKGVVESIEWKNPHSFISIGVTAANGKADTWQIETQPLFVIRQRNADLLSAIKIGDTVTVAVCVAKDGRPEGWLRDLMTSAGTTFDLSGAC